MGIDEWANFYECLRSYSSLLDFKKLHTRQHVICRSFIRVSCVLKRYSNPTVCVKSPVCHLLVLSYLSDRVVSMSVVRAYCVRVQTVIMLEDIENSLRNVKWRRVADLPSVFALSLSFLFLLSLSSLSLFFFFIVHSKQLRKSARLRDRANSFVILIIPLYYNPSQFYR